MSSVQSSNYRSTASFVSEIPEPFDDTDQLACDAIAVAAPELLLLAARTENLAIRQSALLTLSRCAYSRTSAQ